MSGLTLDVGIDGAEALIRRLNNLDLDDGQLKSLHSTLGETGVTQTKERFRDQKSPDGKPWPKSKRAEGEGGQTLTGKAADLKNSINYKPSSREVEVGTSKVYAAIHQFGGVIKPKKGKFLVFEIGGKKIFAKSVTMPARPFLGISPANEKELLAEIDGWLKRRMLA